MGLRGVFWPPARTSHVTGHRVPPDAIHQPQAVPFNEEATPPSARPHPHPSCRLAPPWVRVSGYPSPAALHAPPSFSLKDSFLPSPRTAWGGTLSPCPQCPILCLPAMNSKGVWCETNKNHKTRYMQYLSYGHSLAISSPASQWRASRAQGQWGH
jgi:hypothetical protein